MDPDQLAEIRRSEAAASERIPRLLAQFKNQSLFYDSKFCFIPAGNYQVLIDPQNGNKNLSIEIHENQTFTVFSEALLNTNRDLFLPRITRFKANWDERHHLIPDNFRLILVMTTIFSILLPPPGNEQPQDR
jgi:hypothetical protein